MIMHCHITIVLPGFLFFAFFYLGGLCGFSLELETNNFIDCIICIYSSMSIEELTQFII